MASTSKASQALTAYRRALIDDDVETRVEELSAAVSRWQSHREERESETERLAARERDDEDALADAFDAAKAAGAKPATLAKIGLRPDSAIAAARSRRARSKRPESTPDIAPKGDADGGGSDAAETTASEQVSA